MPVVGTGRQLGADSSEHAALHSRIGLLRRYAARITPRQWQRSKFRPYLAEANDRHAELHHRAARGRV